MTRGFHGLAARLRPPLRCRRLAVGAPAVSPRDGLLVSTSWLAQHLHDANLVLLHVGPKAEFAAGHIAGARYVELHDVGMSAPDGLTLEMPPADTLRSSLEALGISNDSRIVVYYGKDWVSPVDADHLHARLRRARRRLAARWGHERLGQGRA